MAAALTLNDIEYILSSDYARLNANIDATSLGVVRSLLREMTKQRDADRAHMDKLNERISYLRNYTSNA